MKQYQTSGLVMLAVLAAFWAYVVIENLPPEFLNQATQVALAGIFVLGLITGIAAGMLYASWRGQSLTR